MKHFDKPLPRVLAYLPGGGGGGRTLIFSHIVGSDHFWGFKIFQFQYFFLGGGIFMHIIFWGDFHVYIKIYKKKLNIYVTRHAKRYELGGRRHFEKIRLKVNVASRKNSTPTRVSKRSLPYYKTGPKAFFMLRFSVARLSNILYDIKCPF